MSITLTLQGEGLPGCLADPGSVRSIISKKTYESLRKKPLLRAWASEERLKEVGRVEIPRMGITYLEFWVGTLYKSTQG